MYRHDQTTPAISAGSARAEPAATTVPVVMGELPPHIQRYFKECFVPPDVAAYANKKRKMPSPAAVQNTASKAYEPEGATSDQSSADIVQLCDSRQETVDLELSKPNEERSQPGMNIPATSAEHIATVGTPVVSANETEELAHAATEPSAHEEGDQANSCGHLSASTPAHPSSASKSQGKKMPRELKSLGQHIVTEEGRPRRAVADPEPYRDSDKPPVTARKDPAESSGPPSKRAKTETRSAKPGPDRKPAQPAPHLHTTHDSVETSFKGHGNGESMEALAVAVRDALEKKSWPYMTKNILATNLLEGFEIEYRRTSHPPVKGVVGKDGMLYCLCAKCGGKEFTPSSWEVHCESSAKKPAHYIYLVRYEYTLKDFLEAVKALASEDTVSTPASTSSRDCRVCSAADGDGSTVTCHSCKSLYHTSCLGMDTAPTDSWFCPECTDTGRELRSKWTANAGNEEATCTTRANTAKVVKEKERNSAAAAQSLSESKPTGGRMHFSCPAPRRHNFTGQVNSKQRYKQVMIERVGEDVYYKTGNKMLEGKLAWQGDTVGILCSCCNKVVQPRVFETHAGSGAHRPHDYLYLTSTGESLRALACAVEDSSTDVMHSRGRGKGDDERPTWLSDPTACTACALCHLQDFDNQGFTDRTVMICDQCEREFHVGCLRDHKMCNLEDLPDGDWFCSPTCQSVKTALITQVESGDVPLTEEHSWQVLHGKNDDASNNTVLKGILDLLQESFDPIIDPVSRKDLLPTMIYAESSQGGDFDYTGMYSIVLRHKWKPVCAAIMRVFGTQLAELPLVATRHSARRQGHCRVLMNSIETLLKSIGVKVLALPAAEEAVPTWTGGFGFVHMSEERCKTDCNSMLIFPGTHVLYKDLTGTEQPTGPAEHSASAQPEDADVKPISDPQIGDDAPNGCNSNVEKMEGEAPTADLGTSIHAADTKGSKEGSAAVKEDAGDIGASNDDDELFEAGELATADFREVGAAIDAECEELEAIMERMQALTEAEDIELDGEGAAVGSVELKGYGKGGIRVAECDVSTKKKVGGGEWRLDENDASIVKCKPSPGVERGDRHKLQGTSHVNTDSFDDIMADVDDDEGLDEQYTKALRTEGSDGWTGLDLGNDSPDVNYPAESKAAVPPDSPHGEMAVTNHDEHFGSPASSFHDGEPEDLDPVFQDMPLNRATSRSP